MRFNKATSAAKILLPADRANAADAILFDDDPPCFGLRIRSGGKRTWIVQYRVGRKQRRLTLGNAATLDADKARKAAKDRLAEIQLGGDPQNERLRAHALAERTLRGGSTTTADWPADTSASFSATARSRPSGRCQFTRSTRRLRSNLS